MEIREARATDYPSLIEMYGAFVDQPKRYLGQDADSFAAVVDSEEAFLLVASEGEKLIGFVAFSLRRVFRYPDPIIEVEELYVKPQCRKTGLGRALMAEVESFSEKNNGYYIFLASDKERSEAHEFYRALGYDEYGYHYRKRKPRG